MELQLYNKEGEIITAVHITIIGYGTRQFVLKVNKLLENSSKLHEGSLFCKIDFNKLMPELIGKLSKKSLGILNHIRYTEGDIYAKTFSSYWYGY